MTVKNIDKLKKNAMPKHANQKKPFHIPEQDVFIYPKYTSDWSNKNAIFDDLLINNKPNFKLNKKSKVLTIGSCFANNLGQELKKQGIETTSLTMPSNLQNVFSIESFFKWVVKDIDDDKMCWQETNGNVYSPDESRIEFLNDIKKSDMIVITLGLSEVWKDKKTGLIFWRAVPKEIYDESRHDFYLASVDETCISIERIIDLILEANTECKIVITLSPVPLSATFRGKSCITSDCVSKSILRVAIDTTCSKFNFIKYWPSYEYVKEVMLHYNETSFGDDDNYHRHVNKKIVKQIIEKFKEVYFE